MEKNDQAQAAHLLQVLSQSLDYFPHNQVMYL